MALENRDIAILSARFGVARFGASRFGFCPDDVEGSSNDEPGEYIWKEHKPARTDWTLQTPCLICGAVCVASFTASPTSGEYPLEVTFTDTSTGGVTFWYWDFGDGTHSYEQNPTHTYETDGVYTVSLSVSGPGGADGPVTDDITVTAPVVTPAPVAGFDWSWPAESTADFTDTSTGDITDWAWDFSDGPGNPASSTEQNPSGISYPDFFGPFTVVLTVTGPGGSDQSTADIVGGSSGSGD